MFTVSEGEAVVVTTFGKPERALTEPGLYRRWPWPIQRLYRYDNRTHIVEGPFEETLTADGKNILVAVYAGWKIARPIEFLTGVGTADQAERNLDGMLRHHKSAVLGQYPFASLINVEADQLRFEEIEQKMLAAARTEADQRYGITLEFLGIRKIGLPETITEKVFERMRAERTEIAERYRSQGEGEAIKIRAEADSQRDQVLARAEANATRIRAEGDARAAEFYQVFAEDPELAMFLLKLETMEETLKDKATLVLGTETEPYDLLRGWDALPGGNQ